MSEIGIFVGTTYGNALLIAEEAKVILDKSGYNSFLYEEPKLTDWNKYSNTNKCVLVVTSTTGHGDLPENILPLFNAIKDQYNYQYNLRYGIIALGDATYSNFCGGGRKFDLLLQEQNAQRINNILFIDASEQQESKIKFNLWIEHWVTLL